MTISYDFQDMQGAHDAAPAADQTSPNTTIDINKVAQVAVNNALEYCPDSASRIRHDSAAGTLQTSSMTSSDALATSDAAQDSLEPQSVHVAGRLANACVIT